jgi:hypothetical protein
LTIVTPGGIATEQQARPQCESWLDRLEHMDNLAHLMSGCGPVTFRSEPLSTIGGVQDYVGAWMAQRGRCHRLVYDPDGKPMGCSAPPVASGWRLDC